jgi:tetrapyrrole methylase family protein/MazG family protein
MGRFLPIWQIITISKCMLELDKLQEVVRRLRGQNGCPWDHKQTHESLKPCLIEEAHEVLEAIESHDPGSLREELGDLLLQVLFHCQIAEETGAFSIEDVLKTVTQKLIRRHPHVFGDLKAKDSEEALQNWARIKEEERNRKVSSSILEGIPRSLPSLLRAQRVTEKASHAGFDWKDAEGVKEKILEEWKELDAAVRAENKARMEEEFGDLLLSIVNLARFLGIDSEGALSLAVSRFEMRFRFIEKELKSLGKTVRDSLLEEMEILWQEAKQRLPHNRERGI